MIALKGSRFAVSYNKDSGEHNVFVRTKDGYSNITNSLGAEEKEELINDLIYCITNLSNQEGGRKYV